ncbi:hypothetical protein GIB67_004279, partial [Kingdonia uniflora]
DRDRSNGFHNADIIVNQQISYIVMTGDAITGFSQLFEYWFYEYCGVGHPIVKEALKITLYPCLKAWEKGNMKKTNDQAGNLFTIARYLIGHWTNVSINWQPWGTSVALQLNNVFTASYLSRKRMSLQVPNGNYEYYMGNRCWRVLKASITPVVVISVEVHRLSPDFTLPNLERARAKPGVDMDCGQRRRKAIPINRCGAASYVNVFITARGVMVPDSW